MKMRLVAEPNPFQEVGISSSLFLQPFRKGDSQVLVMFRDLVVHSHFVRGQLEVFFEHSPYRGVSCTLFWAIFLSDFSGY